MAKPAKRKDIQQKPQDPGDPDPSSQLPGQTSTAPRVFLGFFGAWTSIILFAFALFFIFKNMIRLGEIFGVAALVFQILKVNYEKQFLRAGQVPSIHIPAIFKPGIAVSLLLPLWLALCAYALTFPSYSWLNPAVQKYVPFQNTLWFPLVLFAGMVWLFRLLPDKEAEWDFSSWTARFWLFASLCLGAYLRVYHISSPPSSLWDDNVYTMNIARRLADLREYQGFFILPQGMLPACPYMSVFLWHFFPDLTTLTMLRLTGVVFDLGTIWILYLAGKEIAGRRMGVFAAVLGAVSKSLIQKCFTGYTDHSIVAIGLALSILFTLRVMKKPDLPHFLQWGVAVGLGAYTSSEYVPFVPVILFWILGWLFLRRPSTSQEFSKPMVWITACVLLVYYLYYCGAFHAGNDIEWFIDFAGPWMPCMVLAAILVFAAYYSNKMGVDQKYEQWTGWVSAAWICTVLSFPILTSDIIFSRVKGNLLNTGQGIMNVSFVFKFFQRWASTFDGLFAGSGDRGDMSMPMDAFFGYPEAILIALGLAFCLARPSLKRLFLLIVMGLGILPYNVAVAPHSGYLVGCVTPALLIGALGLNELLKGLFRLTQSRIFRGLVFAMLLAFSAWSSQEVLSRVYEQFGKHVYNMNGIAYPWIKQDYKQGFRVFLDPDSITSPATEVLYEGSHLYIWHKNMPNILFLGPDENPENVVVYAFPPATEIKARIEKAYPSAQWTQVTTDPIKADNCFALRCFIPGSAVILKNASAVTLKDSPALSRFKKIPPPIEYRRVAGPYWTRQYSSPNAGMNFTTLLWEDKTADINAPPQSDMLVAPPAVRYTGVIHVDRGGKYVIACKTNKRTEVRIDGRKILNLYIPRWEKYDTPGRSVTESLDLEAGDHQVEVRCYLTNSDVPEITLGPKGTPGEKRSLWATFNF